jgi:hypothetical protein
MGRKICDIWGSCSDDYDYCCLQRCHVVQSGEYLQTFWFNSEYEITVCFRDISKHYQAMQDLRFSRRWLWIIPSAGMWCRVDILLTDVSEERIASIFKVEKSASDAPTWAGCCRLQPPAHAGSSRVNFSTLKMEAIFSETSVHTRPHPRRRHSSLPGHMASYPRRQ